MPRRLLLVAVVVLLALLATRALAISSEDTRTGDKPAVDEDGTGKRYTYSSEVKSDPNHITIPMPNYGTSSQLEGGSYVWKHGDEFYIEASELYGQGRVDGTYQFRAYHYITLWYKDTMVNTSAYDSHLDPENPYLYTSFSLSWTSTGAKTVKSWSNSPTVSLGAAQGDYYYGFFSNTGAVSGSVSGGITVYSGTYNLKTHSWFQLLTTTSSGGGGGVLLPFRISIAVVNSTEAANFTARVTGWYYDGQGWGWHRIDSTLHALYNPGFTLNAYTVELRADTLATQGYIAGKLLKQKSVRECDYWIWNELGEYLTGPYLVRAQFDRLAEDGLGLWEYRVRDSSGNLYWVPHAIYRDRWNVVVRSFQALSNLMPLIRARSAGSSSCLTVEWRVYEPEPAVFEFLYWEARWYDTSGVVWEWKTLRTSNPDITLSPPADPSYGVTVTAYYAARKPGQQVQVREVGLGTMYLPGEGIATPWLERADWAWNGTWILNVTEPYPVKEHIVAILTDGSNVRVLDLPNGTSLKVYLPPGWKNNPPVKSMGQMKITRIPSDKNILASTFPSVNVSGQTWYLVALAAWNPYKQFNEGYDTSCWLANGTTLAVYNLTFTYTFKNGTRVVFKEPVVVSTLKVTATPIYTYGDLKQSLSLKVTASWKYLPPARTGIQPSPPSSITGVAVIGNTVYNGTLLEANSTSKTFLVKLADDTWTLYTQGVTSITASAYWLSSMGTPEGPVAMQEPAQLNIVYVMPHIDAISEGSSLTATISIFDVRTDQRYSADIYIELRDNRTFALVAAYGPYRVPGQATITINRAGTKQYVLAIYAIPAPQKDKLVVPIAAVYPPRA